MKKQSGFTLIELMVVMAIVAILATAGLSAYTGYIKKARDTTRAEIARQLMIKIEEYSTVSGAPTLSALKESLLAEGFVPMIESSWSGWVWFADIDPLHGKSVCLDQNSGATIRCGFMYWRISDGSYILGYTVESKQNILLDAFYQYTMFYDDNISTPIPIYANFIGNSQLLQTPSNPGSTIVDIAGDNLTTHNLGHPDSPQMLSYIDFS